MHTHTPYGLYKTILPGWRAGCLPFIHITQKLFNKDQQYSLHVLTVGLSTDASYCILLYSLLNIACSVVMFFTLRHDLSLSLSLSLSLQHIVISDVITRHSDTSHVTKVAFCCTVTTNQCFDVIIIIIRPLILYS